MWMHKYKHSPIQNIIIISVFHLVDGEVVRTNFVIPNRDEQTNRKKNIELFRPSAARDAENVGVKAPSTGDRLSQERGQKEFRGHIASDTLQKCLASAPPRGKAIFLVEPGPLALVGPGPRWR